MPRKPWALGRRERAASCCTGAAQEPEGGDGLSHCLLLGWYRVRSIIMLQEKAQDRERLLLKFIKIMKVAVTPPGTCPSRPCPGRREAPGGRPALTATSPLSAAFTEAQQLQLLPGHPLGAGLGTHPQAGVAEADLRGERLGREPGGAWPGVAAVAGHAQEWRPGLGSLLCHQPAGRPGQPIPP